MGNTLKIIEDHRRRYLKSCKWEILMKIVKILSVYFC